MHLLKLPSLATGIAALLLLLFADPARALLASLNDPKAAEPNSTFSIPALQNKDATMPTSTFYPAVHACPASGYVEDPSMIFYTSAVLLTLSVEGEMPEGVC